MGLRQKLREGLNLRFSDAAKLDESFWEELEEALILGDVGYETTLSAVEELRDYSARKALEVSDIRNRLAEILAENLQANEAALDGDIFDIDPVCVLFVGINGTGKTTTVGKLAAAAKSEGKKVLLGSADTFRAAAIEQLDVWAQRADVEVVKRERGSDPASVCFATIERAEELGSQLVLIDTSGRLHTSSDLMRELEKVVNVVRKRAEPAIAVKTVLVIDATTGQNGLNQAREFNKALELDGLIITKLDGTAKGGIAIAIANELKLPILRIGVGEQVGDLRPFDALEFTRALVGCDD